MQEYITNSYDETVALAQELAKGLKKGTVIAYLGGLGMGKTAFTSGLAKGLGITDDVYSPTFSLYNIYQNGENTLHHFDMYRIDGWDDLDTTGYFDALDGDGYVAVEWSENIYGALPDDALIVEIERIDENKRRFKLYLKSEDKNDTIY